ncbi:MAG: HAD family hydrolase [Armatimonadota bacterium]|nr:HAD family hydrolase [bacterium]
MKAVFLDRDGVINEDRADYVKNVAELKIFSYVPDAVRRLNDAGFKVYVVSNQQGVAKGLIREENLMDIQAEIAGQVEAAGGNISKFYYCRHMASEKCSCRKPEPGLLLSAACEHGIGLDESYMIGDTQRDIIAGKTAGCKTILVLSGLLTPQEIERFECKPDFTATNLSKAVDYIINSAR